MNFYAGIGSRQTPREILELMEQLAYWLCEDECVLRSGHAPGADQAFERGVGQAEGIAEIFLPWETFEAQSQFPSGADVYWEPRPEAFEIAQQFHPAWPRLSQGARKLMARNAHQMLGWNLKSPVRFVLCWTPEGKVTGGTGQSLRMAIAHNIRVFNLGISHIETICRGWVV